MWWTFAGGRGNRLLSGALEERPGGKVTASNVALRLSGNAAESPAAVPDALDELARGPVLSWADAAHLTDVSTNARVSKFQPCLPQAVERELVARELMDVDDARSALRMRGV